MATNFKNKLLSELGTTETLVYSTSANTRTTIIGLSLTNLTAGMVLATVRLEQTDGDYDPGPPAVVETAHYIKDVILPPNQSLRVINGGEKLVLGTNMNVYVQSSVVDSLDLVMSFVEIV